MLFLLLDRQETLADATHSNQHDEWLLKSAATTSITPCRVDG